MLALVYYCVMFIFGSHGEGGSVSGRNSTATGQAGQGDPEQRARSSERCLRPVGLTGGPSFREQEADDVAILLVTLGLSNTNGPGVELGTRGAALKTPAASASDELREAARARKQSRGEHSMLDPTPNTKPLGLCWVSGRVQDDGGRHQPSPASSAGRASWGPLGLTPSAARFRASSLSVRWL